MEFYVNHPVLFVLAGVIILAVLGQSVYFLVKALKRSKELGMDQKKLAKTIKTAAIFTIAPTLVEHACTRTVIFSDVHVQTASIYFNTVPGGKVFMENTGCTVGGIPMAGARKAPLPNEDWNAYSRETPCFYFKGQEVYCRQLNPERSLHEVVNDGGKLWVLGCKTEEEGTAFETYHGGSTEVLGAVFSLGYVPKYPAILNDNSNVSVFAATFGMGLSQQWPIAVREIRGSQCRELLKKDMPPLYMENYVVPLYVGECKD